MDKGVFEFKVGDRDRGFKFGTYAMAIACERDNCDLTELQIRCGLSTRKDTERKVNLMSLLRLFYGAAVQYAKHKKVEVDFEESDVSEWLDDLGIDKTREMLYEGLTSYAPKNSSSPKETGIPA